MAWKKILVKQKGFPRETATWEPLADVANSKALMQAYRENEAGRRRESAQHVEKVKSKVLKRFQKEGTGECGAHPLAANSGVFLWNFSKKGGLKDWRHHLRKECVKYVEYCYEK